jgi:sugar (pentulose or hexulose) kinase
MNYSLGIDFGTSGARAIAIDPSGTVQTEISIAFSNADDTRNPTVWQTVLWELFAQIPATVKALIQAIAIDGTSSTVLLCDAGGKPLLPPLMYNDSCDAKYVEHLKAIVPAGHCVLSGSSSLVKLLSWQAEASIFSKATYFLHQADWLGFLLHGQLGISDYHNSLKLGYEPAQEVYPEWFTAFPNLQPLLPKVIVPGSAIAQILPDVTSRFGLPPTCQIFTGTTDSIAAFLASGAQESGEAVTSLGSSLAVKLLSQHRVDQAQYGIYSHRLGNLWLVGGASNTGAAVLSHFFTPEELVQYSQQIDPQSPSELDYYPLLKPGERFPINDPNLLPRLEPRPDDPVQFLHGLLESLSRIEAQGYQLLQSHGANPLSTLYTAGGGAKNKTWEAIRQRYLPVNFRQPRHIQAAYGIALLAQKGIRNAT